MHIKLHILGTLGTFTRRSLEKAWCQNFKGKSSLFHELKHKAFANLHTTGSKWHCSIKCNIVRQYSLLPWLFRSFLDIQISLAEAE